MRKRYLKIFIMTIMTLFFVSLMVFEIVAQETTTLKVWNAQSGGNAIPTIKDLNQKFEKEYPNIKVEMTNVHWDAMVSKLSVALASGAQPDVANIQIGTARNLVAGGYLAPVDDIVEFIGEDDFFEGYQSYHKQDGHYYGICQLMSPEVMFYRGDLLEKQGLTIPTNWDELLNAAKKLNDPPNVYGFAYKIGTDESFNILLISNDAHILGQKGEVVFDTKETREVFKYLQELNNYCPPGVLTYQFTDISNALLEGRVAMAIHFMDFMTDFAKKHPNLIDDLKAGPIVPNKGKNPVASMWGASQVIFKGKNVDAAKKYLKFMLREDNLIYFLHQSGTGWLPPLKSISENPEFWDAPPYSIFPNTYKSIIAATEVARPPLMEFGPWEWAAAVAGTNAATNAFQKFLIKNEDLDKVIKEAQEIQQEVVGQYK